MIPLYLKDNFDPRYPDFPLRRLQVDIHFESVSPDLYDVHTHYQAAFLDTCTPYLVLPHRFHEAGRIKIHRDLGRKPYRALSAEGDPLLQPFAEVALRFLVRGADGKLAFQPEQFVRVKAYLLEPTVRPLYKVLIGLEPLTENFLMQVAKMNSFLDPLGSLAEGAAATSQVI